jgi:hypothetical protein
MRIPEGKAGNCAGDRFFDRMVEHRVGMVGQGGCSLSTGKADNN